MGVVLWRATYWQNSIRSVMGMPAIDVTYPFSTGFLAAVVGLLLVALGRLMIITCLAVAKRLKPFVPDRVAYIMGAAVVLMGAFLISNDIVARALLHAADSSFARIDSLTDEGVRQPDDTRMPGSSESHIPWDTIGRRGKNFVVSGPTLQDLEAFHKDECETPLRVYVGLRTRDSMNQRAVLALEELKRVNAFDRSLLVIATPTGTGWIDPNAIDTLEYLHRGDTAVVAMQYSYLPSWLTMIVDPARSRNAAQALFNVVYEHWKELPESSRPRLYLHGLSLGALGSETSADLLTTFEEPIDGALFSGPPFPSSQWRSITNNRNEGSPFWRPEIRDQRMVRFQNQSRQPEDDLNWGPIRNVYLQYPSDPMVFFSPDLLFTEPEWLKGERAPDVSPYLRWFPVVTCLQIAFDLPLATNVPLGYGHNYAPSDYIDAWVSVTSPEGFDHNKLQALKSLFSDRMPATF